MTPPPRIRTRMLAPALTEQSTSSTRSTGTAPEIRVRLMDRAAVVPQAAIAIQRQARRSIEIDQVGLLSNEECRRNAQRRVRRATNHNPNAASPGFGGQRECLGQAPHFIE